MIWHYCRRRKDAGKHPEGSVWASSFSKARQAAIKEVSVFQFYLWRSDTSTSVHEVTK